VQAVTLSCPTPGATIRYTLDGSEPGILTGTAYSGAINVSASSAIRARGFKSGFVPSATITQTYLIVSSGDSRRSLPAACLTADQSRSLYRPFGIFAIVNNTAGNYVNGIWTALNDPLQYYNPALRGRFIE